MRPARESYVRVTVEVGKWCVEPAVEYRHGDVFGDKQAKLETLAHHVCSCVCAAADDPMRLAEYMGTLIACTWPDRAYFVEVWNNGQRGWAQMYQPYGIPGDQP